MLWFLLSVVCSSLIYIVFQLAGRKLTSLFTTVVVNYGVCIAMGAVMVSAESQWSAFTPQMGLRTLVLGVLFITTFNLVGKSTQKYGVALTSIVTRVSLILPFLFFTIFYESATHLEQWLGVALSLIAIVMTVRGKSGNSTSPKTAVWLPLAVFLGYGLVDIFLKLAQETGGEVAYEHLLSFLIFSVAGAIGVIILAIRRFKVTRQEMKWGMILGVVNYCSIFFFFLGIKHSGLSTTTLFPLNSILILVVSTFASFIFLKEKMQWNKWVGLLLSIGAIYLLYVRSI